MSAQDDDDGFFKWVDPLSTVGWKLSGGQLVLSPIVPAVNLTQPIHYDQLVAYESNAPRLVEWAVNMQVQRGIQSHFPPEDRMMTSDAGAIDLITFLPVQPSGMIVCKLELGSGPNARVLFADLRPGRFALGPQTFARVSVARWGAAPIPAAVPIDVQSSIVPTAGTDAEPPTFSVMTPELAVNDQVNFSAPPGALWFSVDVRAPVGGTAKIHVNAGDAAWIVQSGWTAPFVFPGPPPWPLPVGASFVDLVNFGPSAASLTITFWVR